MPQVENAKLPSGRHISLPMFPFSEVVADILTDENITNARTLSKDNVDKDT